MGVTGDILARIIKTAGHTVNIANYSNGIEGNKRRKLRPLRIGLDISNWIARAAHGNGAMLVDARHMTNYGRAQLERGEETRLDLLTSEENRVHYVQVCTQKVLQQILALQDVSKGDLLVVFDGCSPPIKKQESMRRRQRKLMAELQRDARVEEEQATVDRRIRAAKVAGAGAAHPLIVTELLQLLRENSISFIVAPFEADAQLAHLAKHGIIDLVMTEDSDLLCHEIPTIMFKYNDWDGEGILIRRQDLGAMELQTKSLSLLDFSTTMIAITFVCIGCDYCDSLLGIGSVSARNIVEEAFRESRNSDVPVLRLIFDKLYDSSRSTLTVEDKVLYEDRFMAALFAYQHPIVFCPLKRKCIVANNPPHRTDPLLLDHERYEALCHDAAKQHELIGAFPEGRFQIPIAEGWVDPRTLRPYPHQPVPAHVRAIFPQWFPEAQVNDDHEGPDEDDDDEWQQADEPETQCQDVVEVEPPNTQQYAAEDTQEAPDTQEQTYFSDAEHYISVNFGAHASRTQQSAHESPPRSGLTPTLAQTQATQPSSQNSDKLIGPMGDTKGFPWNAEVVAPLEEPFELSPNDKNSPQTSTQSSSIALGSRSTGKAATQSTQNSMSPALLP